MTELNSDGAKVVQEQIHSGSLESTLALGHCIAEELIAGDVISLNGELGAGKTQLTRGIAQGLGMDHRLVTSPTYVLMQEYNGDMPMLHLDAYRLSGSDELDTVGWNDETREGSISIIEWAERVEAALPETRLNIEIEHVSEQERALTLTAHGDRWLSRWSAFIETLRHSGF